MKKLTTYILGTIIIALSLATSSVAVAGDAPFKPTPLPTINTIPGPKSKGARDTLVSKILPRFAVGLVGVVGGIGLVFVIIGGVRFTMFYGNEEAVETSKKQVIWGLVGIVVALFAYTIVRTILRIDFVDNRSPAASPPAEESTIYKLPA